MALASILEALPFEASYTSFLLLSSFVLVLSYTFYHTYLDPLSAVPGPLICRLTDTYFWYLSYIGRESTYLASYHERYGAVVRIGPRNISIADGKALAPIYSEKGGFLKAPCYENFDFEGHPTIFSAIDPAHRSVRSKAVLPLFSTQNIRNSHDIIDKCVSDFIQRLQEAATTSRLAAKETGIATSTDVQNISRGLAIDTVCSYLFGQTYAGLSEKGTKLSASEYVDSVVVFGRLFYMPNYLFVPLFSLYNWLYPSEKSTASAAKIEDFTTNLVSTSKPEDGTYQSRLLAAGISPRETSLQMQDVIFAGTDSTGTTTSNILFNLAQKPQIYAKLRAALATNPDHPYLDAVIREGLRTGMANPTRFPRQVPPSGFTFTPTSSPEKTYNFPSGTIVGIQPYSLHYSATFPDPLSFRPERWLEDPTSEMYRDYFPFGLGSRQCIARNLASAELVCAVRAIATSNVLEGARPVKEKIEMMEWFNSRVIGEGVELVWE